MKKSLFSLALISSSLLAVQAATVQIDFGRDDAATDGALNMNYGHSSAALGTMPGDVTLGWSTAGYPVGDDGHTTTKTPGEENGWKNAFGGSMPFSLGDSFRDGLLTQTATGSGSFTVTFSGLAAGEYTLSLFGGFTGKVRTSLPDRRGRSEAPTLPTRPGQTLAQTPAVIGTSFPRRRATVPAFWLPGMPQTAPILPPTRAFIPRWSTSWWGKTGRLLSRFRGTVPAILAVRPSITFP